MKKIIVLLMVAALCLQFTGVATVEAKTEMKLICKVTKKYVKYYDYKINYNKRVFKPKGKMKKMRLAKGAKFYLLKKNASLPHQNVKKVSKTKFKKVLKAYIKDTSGYYYYMLGAIKSKNGKALKIKERIQDF